MTLAGRRCDVSEPQCLRQKPWYAACVSVCVSACVCVCERETQRQRVGEVQAGGQMVSLMVAEIKEGIRGLQGVHSDGNYSK